MEYCLMFSWSVFIGHLKPVIKRPYLSKNNHSRDVDLVQQEQARDCNFPQNISRILYNQAKCQFFIFIFNNDLSFFHLHFNFDFRVQIYIICFGMNNVLQIFQHVPKTLRVQRISLKYKRQGALFLAMHVDFTPINLKKLVFIA